MNRAAESDLASVLRPIGNVVGWWLVLTFVGLPLSGFALWLIAGPRRTANELIAAWIIVFVAISLIVYCVVERRRGVPSGTLALRGIVLSILLVLGASVPVAHLFGTYDRGRQNRALADLATLATIVDEYVATHRALPPVSDLAGLSSVVNTELPSSDPWGRPYLFVLREDDWYLISTGADGVADVEDVRQYQRGPAYRYEEDIVFANGKLLRWPEGTQH